MANYIYSTLATDVTYTLYDKGASDLPVVDKKVFIRGGTGVANKYLQTPMGVMTEVSDAELEIMKQVPLFQRHVDKGFITVEKKNVDPEVVAADMESRDVSAPLVPEDFVEDEEITVLVKNEEVKDNKKNKRGRPKKDS